MKVLGRVFLLVIVFFASSVYCMAQSSTKQKIAILPFNGGTPDERDGIAELFSFTPQIMENFEVIPRTNITQAVRKEQNFQYLSGMTNADTMVRLGNQVGAVYIMAGSITSLGNANLLIVSIVKIDVIQQVAGDFLIYNSLNDLNRNETVLNKMAENLVSIMKKNSENTEKLAIIPVQFSGGANEQEGDALAQLLSIYLIRNGKYSVYPRTKTLEQVQSEYKTQMSGVTRGSETVVLGRGVNPPYVLSVASRRIGDTNRFNASVIDLEKGSQVAGLSERYAALSDGIKAIELIANQLSGISATNRERSRRSASVENAVDAEERARVREERAKARSEKMDKFLKNSGVNLGGWFGFELKESGSYFGGAEIEFRLSPYFGLQTGFEILPISEKVSAPNNSGTKVSAAKNSGTIEATLIQLPILARGNIKFGGDMFFNINLSPYAGIGLNFPLNPTSSKDNIEFQTFSKINLIIGAEIGIPLFLSDSLKFFAGYQYNHAMSDNTYLIDNEVFTYEKSISFLYVGLSWFFPFRK